MQEKMGKEKNIDLVLEKSSFRFCQLRLWFGGISFVLFVLPHQNVLSLICQTERGNINHKRNGQDVIIISKR